MREPSWYTKGRYTEGRIAKRKMIEIGQSLSTGVFNWHVQYSGAHYGKINREYSGSSPSLELAKKDSVDALENYIRTLFEI
jgi:hypothetical protein